MSHDNPRQGHNHAADHLHSHMHDRDAAAELKVLAAQFIDGFRSAADKIAYLRLAGVPFELPDESADEGEGEVPLKLVDIRLSTEWQVGTASPSFGSRALSYLPLTGEMVAERVNMAFVYVSLTRRRDVDLRDFLATRHHRHD
ncbi:MAG: hypothetical protein AAF577_03805 [Pseudomonadota bacterium]